MPLELAPTHICLDHDFGGTDALAIKDSCGDAVQFARVVLYLKEEFDAGIYTELGVTETDSNGRWLTPILLGGWASGLEFYLRVYKAPGYRVHSDGARRFHGEYGPKNFTVVPRAYLYDNEGNAVLDHAGNAIWADVDPGYHSMQILDSDGVGILDSDSLVVTASPNVG